MVVMPSSYRLFCGRVLSERPLRPLLIVFAGGSFRKGVRVPSGVAGGGVCGRVQVGGGWVFLWKKREKGNEVGRVGVGVGVGEQAKEPASQCARVCQNFPLAKYLETTL